MLPTLAGRIQTRLFATLVIGGIWALVLGPLLPGISGATYAERFKAQYGLLVMLAVLGVVWEVIYHGAMQFRWEKDWPTLFGLATLVPEGIVLRLVADHGVFGDSWWFRYDRDLPTSTFLTAFLTTWIVVWLFLNGPMRIFTVHWRFRGGRLV
jgi:hypothetical protein